MHYDVSTVSSGSFFLAPALNPSSLRGRVSGKPLSLTPNPSLRHVAAAARYLEISAACSAVRRGVIWLHRTAWHAFGGADELPHRGGEGGLPLDLPLQVIGSIEAVQSLNTLNSLYDMMHGLNLLFFLARLLKLSHFQPRLGIITRTLVYCLKDLSHYVVVLCFMFGTCSCLVYLVFGGVAPQFSTLGHSFQASKQHMHMRARSMCAPCVRNQPRRVLSPACTAGSVESNTTLPAGSPDVPYPAWVSRVHLRERSRLSAPLTISQPRRGAAPHCLPR